MIRLEGRKSLIPSKGFIRAFLLYRTPKCRNCGRPLRSEESIARGFGPSCAIDFATKYIKSHPTHLGEGAKKLWTKEEVIALKKAILG